MDKGHRRHRPLATQIRPGLMPPLFPKQPNASAKNLAAHLRLSEQQLPDTFHRLTPPTKNANFENPIFVSLIEQRHLDPEIACDLKDENLRRDVLRCRTCLKIHCFHSTSFPKARPNKTIASRNNRSPFMGLLVTKSNVSYLCSSFSDKVVLP